MTRSVAALFVVSLAVCLGCTITEYPIITDSRGDFSGVIRTGHKAYIVPSSSNATVWNDGSDELFTFIYQNNYGDQTLYQFNNFDPTATVLFLDNTYCDWRYEGCEYMRNWNPHQTNVDDIFDYEFFPACSGARTVSLLVSFSSRLGECGDARLRADEQDLAAVVASLAPTTFQNRPAFAGSITPDNTTITLRSPDGVAARLPIYGENPFIITDRLQTVLPVGPQIRHTLQWLLQYVDQNAARATATIQHSAVGATFEVKLLKDGLIGNSARF